MEIIIGSNYVVVLKKTPLLYLPCANLATSASTGKTRSLQSKLVFTLGINFFHILGLRNVKKKMKKKKMNKNGEKKKKEGYENN